MILSFQTDMPGQTVRTQFRLLLEEQPDQGLHCFMVEPHTNFRVITTIIFECLNI